MLTYANSSKWRLAVWRQIILSLSYVARETQKIRKMLYMVCRWSWDRATSSPNWVPNTFNFIQFGTKYFQFHHVTKKHVFVHSTIWTIQGN